MRKKLNHTEIVYKRIDTLKSAGEIKRVFNETAFANKIVECLIIKKRRDDIKPVLYWEAIQPKRMSVAILDSYSLSKKINENNVSPIEHYMLVFFVKEKPVYTTNLTEFGAMVFASMCELYPDWHCGYYPQP